MTKSTKLFHDYILDKEGSQSTLPRTDSLKVMLKRDYPQLSFFAPHQRYKSEMVYVETLPAESLLHTIPTSSSTDTESSDVDKDVGPRYEDLNITRTLYNAALILRNIIKDHPGMDSPWPPTAEHLSSDACLKSIPIELFNFVGWCTGFSEDPVTDAPVTLSNDVHLKIVSICQDIVYVASRGRKQTPKSLCLGLTIRHLSGSSQILDIISRLGHCASKTSIIGFETSLAQLQLTSGLQIPSGFSAGVPTILVWDNIDFNEETVSGKGTTHHTNGIMLQSCESLTETVRMESLQKGVYSLKHTPKEIAPYHLSKKKGPEGFVVSLAKDDKHYAEVVSHASILDFAYIFSKLFMDVSDLLLPGWTGFNVMLSNPPTFKTAIHYLPVIESSPTEMSTVNEILLKSVEKARLLDLDYIVLVFDQAIYAKAQQIRWNDPHFTKTLVVRLGEFHTSMSFLGIIGKFFKDGGLQDVLIESEVTAQGSINGVLSGHHYNRSVRAHKLMYEALSRMRFLAYFYTLNDEKQTSIFDLVNTLRSKFPNDDYKELTGSSEFRSILMGYESYIRMESAKSPTFHYWSIYIELVGLLLNFIRATRVSDWHLHLAAIHAMISWFFAGDRQNYSRYLPAYWQEMVQLPNSHPKCYTEATERGIWTVQRQTSHGFSSIACDQAIEQTLNRDSKTKGGIVGMTLNQGAVKRWTLAQPQRAAITRQCEVMAGISQRERHRKDLDMTRKQRDEDHVKMIMSTIQGMNNPFELESEDLVCISSGVVASEDVKNDILSAGAKGKCASDMFIKNRLIEKSQGLFEPIKTLKLKTFTSLIKSKTTKTKTGKEVSIKNDRNFFARLLVIGQSRNLDLKDILSYSLGNVSFPLASSDGSLAKTDKSAMMKVLENSIPDCLVEQRTVVDQCSAIIIDAMALIQSTIHVPDTFGQLADNIFMQLVSLADIYKCSRVDFVVDTYPEISIKNAERSRRAISGTQIINILNVDQKTPKQWKKFLSVGRNKENLSEFLFNIFKEVSLETVKDKVFYITHGHACHLLKWDETTNTTKVCEVDSLQCDHEEADTRLLLHSKHASCNFDAVIIKSPDTDVFVMSIANYSEFDSRLYFLTGVKNLKRIIDISKIARNLDNGIPAALIGIHVFSGCDSTSAFYGKGKKKIYQLACKHDNFIDMFSKFGAEFSICEELLETLQIFICKLYNVDDISVNAARYKLFCSSKSVEQNLPPTLDALTEHFKRSNYQAAIYRRCLKPYIRAPSPKGHGWALNDGELSIVWMNNKPALEAILEVLQCACKTGCKSGRCSCLKGKLKCTDLCHCVNCQNLEPRDDQDIVNEELLASDDSDIELFDYLFSCINI